MEFGFRREPPSGPFVLYSKDRGSLIWTVALTRVPQSRFPQCSLYLQAEVVVRTPELNRQLGIEPSNWTFGPIRLPIRMLPSFPDVNLENPDGWCINNSNEARECAASLISIMKTYGLPFLQNFESLREVSKALRLGGAHVFGSLRKACYDADVLDGVIDPKATPFVPEKTDVFGNPI